MALFIVSLMKDIDTKTLTVKFVIVVKKLPTQTFEGREVVRALINLMMSTLFIIL